MRLPGVFEPPSDAWMLIRYMENERLAVGAQVLDLCTGSGALAIAAAQVPRLRVGFVSCYAKLDSFTTSSSPQVN